MLTAPNDIVPPPVKFSKMPEPEITVTELDRFNVPPAAWKNVEVEPDAGARVIGTVIVFEPEVLLAPIATAVELLISVPMLVANPVSVNVPVVLVKEYPEEAVVEKYRPAIFGDVLARDGFVPITVVNHATSPGAGGSLPETCVQLPAVLQAVLKFFQSVSPSTCGAGVGVGVGFGFGFPGTPPAAEMPLPPVLPPES